MIKAQFVLCGRDPETEQSLKIEGHVSLSKAKKAAKKKNWKYKSIWKLIWEEGIEGNDGHKPYYGEPF